MVVERRRQVDAKLVRWHGRSIRVLVADGERGVGMERRSTGQELVEHAAQAVHIGGRPGSQAHRPLGGEAETGADGLRAGSRA
ncbi:hypothetical protein [Streptomyces fulvoviolaceus]|uniref:hypothetical protein n=1 Tax=Streptomyces fulvoviolaceus TaxID=285535 RepID=UPI0004CB8EB6|nr:hypothetical protein [Streptomyces fulvoviolaceus]MCT9079852.1 hypothetical protein [Streptomyces fulvoviolaceus]